MNENVTVCITPKGDKPVLHFSQFDNDRTFTVTVLADDGESAAVLTGLDIEFRLRKTDSHVVTIAPESVSDNVITFKTTEQMCACCGQNIASVKLMKDDMNIATLDIFVDIQRDILSGGLTSESDIRNLTTQIEQIVPEVIGDDYYNKQEIDEKIAEIPTFDPTNYYDKSDVDDLLSAKMDNIGYKGIVEDADVISFNTDSDAPLAIIKGKITPVQDLHGYSKPWSGGGGKNKANKANDLPSGSGITITVANDGTLTINGTSTETCFIRGYFNCPDSTATYTWALFNNKAFESGVEFSVRISDNSSAGGWARVNATNKTFSFTPSAAPTKWQFQISSGVTFNNAVFKPMIVSGNTSPTDFEPYSNICPISGFSALNVTLADGDMQTIDTKTVNFGQTVYGGVADVTGGNTTSKYERIKISDITWTASGDFFYSSLPLKKVGNTTFLCECLRVVDVAGVSAMVNGDIKGHPSNTNMYIKNTDWASATDLYNAIGDYYIVYELATPIEITTTPVTVSSIAGDNNIYIDTGNLTEIAYFEGVEDNLIKLIKACQI